MFPRVNWLRFGKWVDSTIHSCDVPRIIQHRTRYRFNAPSEQQNIWIFMLSKREQSLIMAPHSTTTSRFPRQYEQRRRSSIHFLVSSKHSHTHTLIYVIRQCENIINIWHNSYLFIHVFIYYCILDVIQSCPVRGSSLHRNDVFIYLCKWFLCHKRSIQAWKIHRNFNTNTSLPRIAAELWQFCQLNTKSLNNRTTWSGLKGQ